ncbi:MAG: DNRLRE domain-containing protein, partial [Patescibacteria group bacterium]
MSKEPFGKIVSVSSILTLLLTLSIFVLQYSENGTGFGIDFSLISDESIFVQPIKTARKNVEFLAESLPAKTATAATTIAITDLEDNSLDQGASTTTSTPPGGDNEWNQGGQSALAIGLANGPLKNRRSLIKFNLSAVPAGATITNAELQLTCIYKWNSNADNVVNAHRILRPWVEGTSADGTWIRQVASSWFHTNYPEQWGQPGADQIGVDRSTSTMGSATITATCTNTTYSWNLDTATVTDWVNNPSTNYGMMLTGNESTQDITRQFASSENATTANRPKLFITYTTGGADGDTVPPVISNGAPTGTLTAGTTSTSISVTTDESATCKASTTAGVSYNSMPLTFTNTGGVIHTDTLNNLANGSTYNYSIRCQDVAGNINTSDYSLTFSIASGTSSPVCGNGVIESGEQCEGSNLNSASCISLGYSGGALSCSGLCQYVTTACTTPPTSSSIFHVRTDGSDTACNGSANAASSSAPSCAFKTIQKAVNSLTAAGNRIIIHAGTYSEYVQIGAGQPNGTAQNPIIIEGDPSVPRSSIIVDGSAFDGTFLVNGAGGSTTKAYYIFQHFSFRTGRLQGMELGTFANGLAANMVARDLEVHSINFVQTVPYNSRVITASTWGNGPYGNNGNMLIEDVVIDNAENGGVVASGDGIFATSGHTIVRRTNIKDVKAFGRVGNATTLEFNTWEFSNCDSDGGCIQLYNGYGLVMRYNTIRVKNSLAAGAGGRVMETRCCAAGTSLASSPDFASAIIYNNVFDYQGTAEVTAIRVDHGSQYVSIRNNIFKGFRTTSGSSGVWSPTGSNCANYEFKYNALYNSNLNRATTGCGTTLDPTNLADTATLDFNTSSYIANAGSRLINTGDPTLSVPVGGGARSDVGAYENGAGTAWPYDFQTRDTTTSNLPILDWGNNSSANINLAPPYGFSSQTGYQCQIDSTMTFNSQGFAKPLYDSGAPNTSTATSCQPTTSLPNGNYFGRVRFRNEVTAITAYTGVWSDHYYKFSVGSTSAPVCGNGIVESGEQCDGFNLGGASCTSQGFTGGTLSCSSSSCQFVTTQCTQTTGCGSTPAAGTPEGWGANTTGGAGQPIICVTNLNDSGAGSLREAVTGSNRRIYFSVGGTINLLSRLDLHSQSNVTIDGSTAPAPGITISGQQFEIKSSSNIIVRHLRSRNAVNGGENTPGFAMWCPIGTCSNFWFDHLSIYHASDDSILVYGGIRDATISNSIIYEAATTPADPLSTEGMLISGTSGAFADRISVHHNVITKNHERNPSISGDSVQTGGPTTVDFRNNVVHNWGIGGYGTRFRWNATGNAVKNVYFSANSPTSAITFETPYRPVYLNGNYEQSGVSINILSTSATPITAPSITENTLGELRSSLGSNPLLDTVGASPRDSVDTTAIAAVAADIVSGGTPPPTVITTYHVRTDGSDTACNGGTNAASSSAPNCAFRMIQKGINTMSAGNTVLVHAGTYGGPGTTFSSDNLNVLGLINGKSGGSASNRYTIASAPGETVLLDGNASGTLDTAFFIYNTTNVTIEGFQITDFTGRVRGTLHIEGNSNDIEIQNNTFSNSTDSAGEVHMNGWAMMKIRSNVITTNAAIAIFSSGPSGGVAATNSEVSNNTILQTKDANNAQGNLRSLFIVRNSGVKILNNYIASIDAAKDPDSTSMYIRDNTDVQVKGNVVSGYLQEIIFQDSGPADGVTGNDGQNQEEKHIIVNNVFDGTGVPGDQVTSMFGSEKSCDGCVFANNILMNFDTGWRVDNNAPSAFPSSTLITKNVYYNVTRHFLLASDITEIGNITSTSLPVTANGSKPTPYFSLASGSLAINSGDNTYCAWTPSDGQCDIGAYEFTGTPVSDTTPPVRSNGLPTGTLPSTTTQAILSLSTDENATCKYGTTIGISYVALPNTFTTTGSAVHSVQLSNLTSGTSYTYYVRCQDTASTPNTNTTDYVINFTVASDTTPPVR